MQEVGLILYSPNYPCLLARLCLHAKAGVGEECGELNYSVKSGKARKDKADITCTCARGVWAFNGCLIEL